MWDKVNFLCEIGTEEIPAGYIPPALNNIEQLFIKNLEKSRISFNEIKLFATPRRFIVTISDLAPKQKEEELELKGPSLERAYDANGKPSKALEGFMRGNGITEKDLEKRETDKGTYIFGKKIEESKPTDQIIPDIVKELLDTIPFPKKMRWSDKEISFPRPIRYLLILLNNQVVELNYDGIISSNKTRGHYIQSSGMLEVKKIAEYPSLLKKADVIIDQIERKENILKQLKEKADECDCVLVEDEELLDTVTYLNENPHVVLCEFNPDFLKIPDIVLIAEMKEHQKYFALRKKDGSLSNYFLVTSNNPYSDYIKKGNERVIAARFSDADFFFTEDRKHRLESKVEGLKNVLFHKDLGSIYDKIIRMQKVAAIIAKNLNLDADTNSKIERAILLSKADLNTALVYEFTSLQGQIGKIYALMDGEDQAVAAAIEEHYQPRFHGDKIVENIISVVVSLAEKIDNLLGSFSVGNIPKGSQDPYALRRQAFAIIEIIIHNKLRLEFADLLNDCAENYKDGTTHIEAILSFITIRAKTYFQDAEIKYDEIDACLSVAGYDYYEKYIRALSLHEFRADENFSQMLLSFKRMNNIFSSFIKKNNDYKLQFNESLLTLPAEKNLFEFFNNRKTEFDNLISNNNYKDLFSILIEAKPVIDKFFDEVMVMDKDIKIRDNRLAVIENIIIQFASLLDFSKISGE